MKRFPCRRGANFTALFLLTVLLNASVCWGAQTLRVPVDRDSGALGKYLLGIHFVYSDEKDSFYKDGWFAQWAKKAGISVARFPGGTVIKYWDWKSPTGYIKEDAWDPEITERADPANWMSMDEYLDFIRVSGAKPLIGINLLSGVRFNRVEESVRRAAEQVRYVVSKGHKGAFYYLGNEDMGDMGGLEKAAEIFVKHAQAVKSADPSAKLFWNDNHINPERLKRFLSIAGKYADGVEFHGKWPYGGKASSKRVTLEDWREQYPIREEKWGSFSERVAALRETARSLGYPGLLFANNEYGLAQFKEDRFFGYNRFHYSLVVLELLQDLFIGQFDMAAFWSNVPADRDGGQDREMKRLIDTKKGNRLNPMHFGFEMLSPSQGKKLVKIEGVGTGAYGFAAWDGNTLEIFLLNKTATENEVLIGIEGGGKTIVPGKKAALVDTPDHWGTVLEEPVVIKGKSVATTLAPLSYNKITVVIR